MSFPNFSRLSAVKELVSSSCGVGNSALANARQLQHFAKGRWLGVERQRGLRLGGRVSPVTPEPWGTLLAQAGTQPVGYSVLTAGRRQIGGENKGQPGLLCPSLGDN